MANEELDDRVIYNPRGKNAEDNLANCIHKAAPIFLMDGELVWIADGARRQVARGVVLELCRRFVVTAHPVERDRRWTVEYRPFVPPELMVRNLIRESLPKMAIIVQPEVAPPVEQPELRVYDPRTQLEIEAGRRVLARHARGAERLAEEMAAGQRALAKHREREQVRAQEPQVG
jgi:hypothetical protein